MTIRKTLNVGICLLTLIVVTSGVALFLVDRRVDTALSTKALANQVQVAVNELAILTSDFLYKRNTRAEAQWRTRHESLKQLVADSDLQGIDSIAMGIIRLGETFDRLTSINKSGLESDADQPVYDQLVERLAGQLSVISLDMSGHAKRVAAIAHHNLQSLLREAELLVMGLGILLATTLVLAVMFGHHRLFAPVDRIREHILALGKGQLEAKIDIARDDEIGVIGRELNAMADNLVRTMASRDDLELEIKRRAQAEAEILQLNETLEQKVADRTSELESANRKINGLRRRWELILQSAGEGIYGLDLDGNTTFANPAAARIVGYEIDELMDKPQHDIIHHSRPDGTPYPKEECPIYAALVDGKTHQIDDEVFWRRDGTGVPVEYVSSPLRNDAGELEGAVVMFRDITERRQQEAAIKQANQRLLNANKELEAFSYSVSHDLRAPLRTISGFSQALLEDHTDQIDDDGKFLLARIRGGAERMSQLIDDILKLSRLSRQKMERQTVDLSALVRTVVSDSRDSDSERDVEVVIEDEIIVNGDPVLLEAVMRNLVGNAWKYTVGTQDARIEFGRRKDPDKGVVYFVRDNGAGFDMAYAGKLFTPFQRLHRQEEFEGTGVGLATVSRAINRHGGQIWAEAAVGEGATFHFTLPSTEDILL